MIPTLYLHAGMHKTGSTSIQGYLRRYRRAFASKGYRVVESGDPWQGRIPRKERSFNCSYIANIVIRNSLQTNVRLSGRCECLPFERKLDLAKQVNRFLRDADSTSLIMSAEAFCLLRTDEEKALYDLMFDGMRVVPIVYFRDKQSWLASWEKQLAKNGLALSPNATRDVGVFDLSPNSWLVDHDSVRRFFGPEGVFLDYDDDLRREGSVVPGFLRSLRLDPADCPSTKGFFLNKSGARPRRHWGGGLRQAVRRWL